MESFLAIHAEPSEYEGGALVNQTHHADLMVALGNVGLLDTDGVYPKVLPASE